MIANQRIVLQDLVCSAALLKKLPKPSQFFFGKDGKAGQWFPFASTNFGGNSPDTTLAFSKFPQFSRGVFKQSKRRIGDDSMNRIRGALFKLINAIARKNLVPHTDGFLLKAVSVRSIYLYVWGTTAPSKRRYQAAWTLKK
jgi:hypothetical protein